MKEFVLENEYLKLKVLDYGARIIELTEKYNGVNIILGYSSNQKYLEDKNYFGATIGPNANRIKNATFSIGSKKYFWEKNDGDRNNLHSSPYGLDHVEWEGRYEKNYIVFEKYTDKPFKVFYKAVYRIKENKVMVEYDAFPKEYALINMTNHTYFNLNGDGNILNHRVRFFTNKYTPIDDEGIPTGKIQLVYGSEFDFTHPREIGEQLKKYKKKLGKTRGYDHNFLCKKEGFKKIAEVDNRKIKVKVFATAPGFQFYTGNNIIIEGQKKPHSGLCIEPQYIPSSMNLGPSFKLPIFPAHMCERQKIMYQIEEYKIDITSENMDDF